MRTTYDPTVDALYIQLNEKPRQRGTRKITDTFILDFDVDGNVQGIEILNASQSVDNPLESAYQLIGKLPMQVNS
ncbi:MAG: DUF2283 domain-containing protein [Chloroflexota bacterium]